MISNFQVGNTVRKDLLIYFYVFPESSQVDLLTLLNFDVYKLMIVMRINYKEKK